MDAGRRTTRHHITSPGPKGPGQLTINPFFFSSKNADIIISIYHSETTSVSTLDELYILLQMWPYSLMQFYPVMIMNLLQYSELLCFSAILLS